MPHLRRSGGLGTKFYRDGTLMELKFGAVRIGCSPSPVSSPPRRGHTSAAILVNPGWSSLDGLGGVGISSTAFRVERIYGVNPA